jgi:hypothetical protein
VLFCIRNVGSQSVTLAALVDDLTDVDVACTGDEALHGDASCGDNLDGELSDVLNVHYVVLPCDGTLPGGPARSTSNLKANATVANSVLGTLAAGAIGCFMVEITYPSEIAGMQQAQSDRATWRFAFTAAS